MARLLGLLLAGVGEAAMVLRHQIGKREQCEKFAFLRIQKTGSTTFEQLIPYMTPGAKSFADKEVLGNSWRLPLTHINYRDIKEEMPISCAAVLLRDPVDRFLSEFNMLRSSEESESAMLDEDQWDFTYDQLEALNRIRNNTDVQQALLDFINFPANPSRNRQALYLLGFERVTCRKSPTTGNACCGVCVKNLEQVKPAPGGNPALAYDWDNNEEEVLEIAKQHLKELLTFGITDCYEASIRAMAPKLNWDANVALEHASGMHEREADKQTLDPSIEEMIRTRNHVDNELVKYAKQLFEEQNGLKCEPDH